MGGLYATLSALHQGYIGIRVLQEMNLVEGIHMRYSLGYKIWETEVDIRYWGGFTIVWREEVGCQIEGTKFFG